MKSPNWAIHYAPPNNGLERIITCVACLSHLQSKKCSRNKIKNNNNKTIIQKQATLARKA